MEQILDNLPHTLFTMCTHSQARANTHTRMQAHTDTRAHTHPAAPPSALSGTSLNIHHSGCSESAVNAASHSRESLKPTLSSALPPSSPSRADTRARTLDAHSHTVPVTKINLHTLEGAASGVAGHMHRHTHTHTAVHESDACTPTGREQILWMCVCVCLQAAPSTEV